MLIGGGDERRVPGMRMAAMIDVVFLLVIFFMLVTELSKMEDECMALPVATRGVDDRPRPGRVVVNVKRSGAIVVQRREYSAADLGWLLRELSARRRDTLGLSHLAVKIRADANADYGSVQRVMLECMRHGIWRLSFGCMPTPRMPVIAPAT